MGTVYIALLLWVDVLALIKDYFKSPVYNIK